jgi:SOUL heme-binding protein
MNTADPSLQAPLPTTSRSIATLQRDALSSHARRARWLGRASFIAPLLAGAAGAGLMLLDRRHRAAGLGLLGTSLGFGLVRWQLQRLFTEQVPYDVHSTIGAVEIRHYPPQIWAETRVTGVTWTEALSEGFERLAGYIFGENVPCTLVSTEAARQRSLRQATTTGGERLSMTAPVLATLGNDPSTIDDRTIAFVMPADRRLEDLPTPRDVRIRLRAVPARRVAVLGFNGDYKSELPAIKSAELLEWLRAAHLTAKGPVTFAGYDPPSTLPALRRNEVSLELEPVLRV